MSKASLDANAGGYRNDADGDPLNDGDLDDPRGATQSTGAVDSDKDFAEDHQNPGNGSYHDSDDRQIVEFGHEAQAGDRRTIAQLVERYYAIAAARDGAAACALLPHPLAASAVEDFGSASAASPAYLRHASTCSAVLAGMFAHEHSQVLGVHVTDVRVEGAEALALLGSDQAPASSIALSRVHGRWRLEAMIGKPLN